MYWSRLCWPSTSLWSLYKVTCTCFVTNMVNFWRLRWSSICWKYFPAYNNEKVYKLFTTIDFARSLHVSFCNLRLSSGKWHGTRSTFAFVFHSQSTLASHADVLMASSRVRRSWGRKAWGIPWIFPWRLSPLRMDLKIINTKQEYNKLAMVGQYPPYSWLDIDTLESRFFKPPVEKKKWNRTLRKFETPRVWGIGILLWTRCVIVHYLVIYVISWPH